MHFKGIIQDFSKKMNNIEKIKTLKEIYNSKTSQFEEEKSQSTMQGEREDI